MRQLYGIVIIFSIAVALLGSPLTARAESLPTLLSETSNYTVQVSAEDFYKSGAYKVLIADYKGAIADLAQAIRLNPNDANAYTNLGLARAATGDRSGAIADFNSALRLNPSLAIAYYNRGFIRSELQDYQGAIADFSSAIQLNPADADAYHCRCFVHYTLGDKRRVIEDFQKAADLYLQQGKLEEYQGLVKEIKELYSNYKLPTDA